MAAPRHSQLAKVRELSARDLLFLAIAVKELALARRRHLSRPVGEIIAGLREPASNKTAQDPAVLRRLSWALGAAAARVPWRADCLPRVMAADRWLRRLGAVPEFGIGVMKKNGDEFTAHAWLTCDGVQITGGGGEEFTTLVGSNSKERLANLNSSSRRGEDS